MHRRRQAKGPGHHADRESPTQEGAGAGSGLQRLLLEGLSSGLQGVRVGREALGLHMAVRAAGFASRLERAQRAKKRACLRLTGYRFRQNGNGIHPQGNGIRTKGNGRSAPEPSLKSACPRAGARAGFRAKAGPNKERNARSSQQSLQELPLIFLGSKGPVCPWGASNPRT